MTLSTEDRIQRGPAINKALPDGLARHIFSKLLEHGDSVAEVYPERGGLQLTFATLAKQAALTASALRRLGLKPGDLLGLASVGGPHFTPLVVGAWMAGVIIAPFNPDFDEEETRHVLGFLRPKVLIADKPSLLHKQLVPTVFSCKEVKVWFIGHVEEDLEIVEPPSLDAPAVVLCSSGTTGYPKGVEISHRALLQLIAIGSEKGMMTGNGTSFLLPSPAFWISATALMLVSTDGGGKIVSMVEFNEQLVFKALKEHKVWGTLLSPYIGVKLCKMTPPPDLSPMKLMVFGGSVLDRATQDELQRKFKIMATQMYGMTELLVTLGSDGKRPTPPGSVGCPEPNVEVKVVDTQTGDALGAGEDGELCFRGPTVTRGYYNNPEATAAAIDKDGWFHTGDIGYYDENGFFYITDRVKDFIKYKGHHVPSALMEAKLLKHPSILEAAVIGVPNPPTVELSRAYVAQKAGEQVSEKEILDFVNSEASEHKQIQGGVVFMEKLPRTATGKTCKRILREQARREVQGR